MDSAVAAALLKNQGFEVHGLFIHVQAPQNQFQFENPKSGAKQILQTRCCKFSQLAKLKGIAKKLDLPLVEVHAEEEFEEKVIDYFVHEYLQARVPNPCVPCNLSVRINTLFKKAKEMGIEMISTGHYAQVSTDHSSGERILSQAVDPSKDQSHLLYSLEQEHLKHLTLPLGGLSQTMVEKLAREFEILPEVKPSLQTKPCLVGEKGYGEFIESRAARDLRPPGVVQRTDGVVIGEHYGIHRYSIGSTGGYRLSMKEVGTNYIVSVNKKTNTIVIGTRKGLFYDQADLEKVTWINPINPLEVLHCVAKIGFREIKSPCEMVCFENQRAEVKFEKPVESLNQGETIVFYSGERVIGGAVIHSTSKSGSASEEEAK